MKKVLYILYLFFCFYKLYSLDFKDMIELAYKNNQNLLQAKVEYEKSLFDIKNKNGVYSSSVSTIVALPSQKNGNHLFDEKNILSSITYSKKFPGNLALSISADYSVNYSDLTLIIYQSLKPFWIKGKIKDPNTVSFELQKEYYWYELNYQKKNIIENLTQVVSKTLIYNNECRMLKNDISLLQLKIDAQKKLCSAGNSNKSQITELESEKWNKQQSLINYEIQIENYLLELRTLCGTELELVDLDNVIDVNNTDILFDFIELNIDPVKRQLELKKEMLNQNNILQNQNSSPMVSLSFQPVWNSGLDKDINNWTISIGLDFSPFIESTIKKENEIYKIEYEEVKDELSLYLKKKSFLIEQCENTLKYYNKILEESEELYIKTLGELEDYKILYSTGLLSELDYESVKMRVNNSQIAINNLQINIWTYYMVKSLLGD